MTTTARTTIRDEIRIDVWFSDCATCGVVFGIPKSLEDRRRLDGRSFWCPNGHSLSFGKSEADKLREQLERSERQRRFADEAWQQAVDREQATGRQLSATRGVVTKLRKRAHAGACPFGCRRHFADLERHVATKHPGAELPGES